MSTSTNSSITTSHRPRSASAMPYKPRVGTLPAKVIGWLQDNPDEELTAEDAARKWGTYPSLVAEGLKLAVASGALRLDTNSDHQRVYRLPVAPTAAAVAGTSPFRKLPADTAQPPAPTRPRQPTTPPLRSAAAAADVQRSPRGMVTVTVRPQDFERLKVDTGVPITGRISMPPGQSKWAPVFDLLTEPGTSVEIPASWKVGVSAQASRVNRAAREAGQPTHYTVRVTGAGKARIWRDA